MPETAQIPEVDAPVNLFLSGQLEAEQEATRAEKKIGLETKEADWEFGEQVDYGIGG
ncbi:MAG: hypothetical protein K2N63_01695 [Lachnospiraceae bacterium]|nr:hypothetical protein [Lachnospiraceae bacterium]